MLELKELETQQVGLRLPKYLVNDVDEIIKDYDINRSTFITNALQQVVKEQKEKRFYARLDNAVAQMKKMMDGEIPVKYAEDLLDELDN